MRVKKITLVLVSLFCSALCSHNLTAQPFYYVVIGGFKIENNAKKFTGYARTKYYNARYELNQKYNLFYVYVQKTNQHDAAYSQTRHLQRNSEFNDAWVFSGILGDTTAAVASTADEPFIEEPDTTLLDNALTKMGIDSLANIPSDKDDEPLNISLDERPIGKVFKFLIQTEERKILSGNVHHVDFSRGRDIAAFPAGRNITILPPTKAHNPMTVVCGIFGYKEVVKSIDYQNPEATEGVSRDESGTWIITYPLERLKTGDVSVMYHVSFYKDAVVMLTQSKPELDELVNIMHGNPNYKIKIHGHCNGTHDRRIIALGKTKNYFSINGSDEIKGSAKTLSKLRAEAIQSYLVDHGIDKGRTQIYAWGGTNMLVDENSTSAKLNDRIEIEILAD